MTMAKKVNPCINPKLSGTEAKLETSVTKKHLDDVAKLAKELRDDNLASFAHEFDTQLYYRTFLPNTEIGKKMKKDFETAMKGFDVFMKDLDELKEKC